MKRFGSQRLTQVAVGHVLACFVTGGALADTTPAPGMAQTSAAPDPCNSLFALVSRPTITTSTCVVKPSMGLVEFGYSNAVTGGSGNVSSIPTAALRAGIVRNLEADVILPTFDRSSASPIVAGLSDSALGLKYQFATTQTFIHAVHVFLTTATGAKAFTGASGGTTASYDVSYSVSSKFGLAGTFGYNSFALQGTNGVAKRYSAFNPSFVLSNSFRTNVQSYIELYGGSISGPNQSGRYCVEGGLQADVSHHLQFDASLGIQCINITGPSQHYVNVGGALRF